MPDDEQETDATRRSQEDAARLGRERLPRLHATSHATLSDLAGLEARIEQVEHETRANTWGVIVIAGALVLSMLVPTLIEYVAKLGKEAGSVG